MIDTGAFKTNKLGSFSTKIDPKASKVLTEQLGGLEYQELKVFLQDLSFTLKVIPYRLVIQLC